HRGDGEHQQQAASPALLEKMAAAWHEPTNDQCGDCHRRGSMLLCGGSLNARWSRLNVRSGAHAVFLFYRLPAALSCSRYRVDKRVEEVRIVKISAFAGALARYGLKARR